LRRAAVEQKHALPVGERLAEGDQSLLDAVANETAEQMVQRLREVLSDPRDRAIFDGKLAGHTKEEIGKGLNRSTRWVGGRWQRIVARLRQDDAEEAAARGN
jgi:hypothetical protein